MADEGYYRSDGIQNSGTALTVNNQNVYIFTGTGFMQIYPREISQTISNSNFGGFTTSTYRSTGDWRDCAYQGVKSVGYNKNRLRINVFATPIQTYYMGESDDEPIYNEET